MYYQTGKNKNDIVQWNQSCIQILERTESFMNAVKLANEVMKPSYSNHHHSVSWFKPVSCEPHFSWAYTDHEIDTSSFIRHSSMNFSCETIILMKTSPSSFQGISQWKPIGSPISLI